ncbi:MAG: acyltransferase [Allosphingosinicella sp.]
MASSPVTIAHPTTLASLQAGRAAAAMAVVAFHGAGAVSLHVEKLPYPLAQLLRNGYLGVDFFFVLSGFIIYYANARHADRPGWASRYAWSRFARIYIPYLPVGIAMVLGYLFLGWDKGRGGWSLLSSLTLLPAGPPALAVGWTLQHEIFFYALFWLLMKTRLLLAGSLIWAGLIVAASFLYGVRSSVPLSLINLEFLFGMAAAWAFLNGRLPAGAILLAVGSLIVGGFLMLGGNLYSSPIFGLGMTLIIAAAIRAEVAGRLAVARLPVLLGNASYAIYLVHFPLISMTVWRLRDLGANWAAALSAAICLSAVAGLAYHLLYEAPALRAARRRISGRIVRPPPRAEAQPRPVEESGGGEGG